MRGDKGKGRAAGERCTVPALLKVSEYGCGCHYVTICEQSLEADVNHLVLMLMENRVRSPERKIDVWLKR